MANANMDLLVNIESVQIEVAKLTLQPGDVLVLHIHAELNEQRMMEIRERMTQIFPEIKILVLDKSSELTIIRKERA